MDPGVLLAVEMRGGHPEVANLGHAVVLDAGGRVAAKWGDPSEPAFWRSTAKPLQAVPFAHVRERFGLGTAELAVACASHTGEAIHAQAVQRILDAIGLQEAALRCGTHPPWGARSAFTAETARPLYSNCSGCHAGLLAACVAEGWDTATYDEPGHPLQKQLVETVRAASGHDPAMAIDGCGLPTYRTPLDGLARAFQWLLEEEPAVLSAMAHHPEMVGGTAEFDTDLLQATRGRVVGKYGALGVYAAVDRDSGEAVAVRVTTGNELVCEALAGRILAARGLLDEAEREAIAAHLELKAENSRGETVGGWEFRI